MTKPRMIGATMMTAKMKSGNDITLKTLFEMQAKNQEIMLSKGMYDGEYRSELLPIDDVKLSSYHALQLMSELGEVLDADKRWKNFRNVEYNMEGKSEEIADCFIVLMNIAMFSGIGAEELSKALVDKIGVVKSRIMKE